MKGLRNFFEFTFLTCIGISLIWLFSFLFAAFFTKDGRIDNFLFHEIREYLVLYLLMLWLLGITYKKVWDFQSFNKSKFLLFVFCLILASPVLIKLLFLNRCNSLYKYLKGSGGYSNNIFKNDPELGHSFIPYGKAFEPYYVRRESIPVFIDSEGFRSDEKSIEKAGKKINCLFLGCSFTWGSFCKAEESYPVLVSEQMGWNYINAGGPAYGLAQMYRLGQELIPRYKPGYVFAQYSPWLAERNTKIFQNIFFYVDHPYPYFVETDTGIVFHVPPFVSELYELPIDKFKKTPAGFKDKMDFYREICFPLFIIEPVKKFFSLMKIWLGFSPTPIKDCRRIEHFVYDAFQKICKANNSRLVILNIGKGSNEFNRTSFKKTLSGNFSENVCFLNVDSFLIAGMEGKNNYSKKYQFWNYENGDTVFTDPHPNPMAHKLMADFILKNLKGTNK